MPLIFGSREANEQLARDKRGHAFGPGGLVGHEITVPVDLRIAPNGEPRPPHDLANEDWIEEEEA